MKKIASTRIINFLKRQTIVALFIGLFAGIIIGFLADRLGTGSLEYTIGGITDTYNYPEISIDNEGNFFHDGRHISESELVEIIKMETQKTPQSFDDVALSLSQDGVLPMYGTIMLHVHDDLPFKQYIAISRLISKHGGYVATSQYTSHGNSGVLGVDTENGSSDTNPESEPDAVEGTEGEKTTE